MNFNISEETAAYFIAAVMGGAGVIITILMTILIARKIYLAIMEPANCDKKIPQNIEYGPDQWYPDILLPPSGMKLDRETALMMEQIFPF